MLFSRTALLAAFAASAAAAGQTVVYWGQNTEQGLAEYCAAGQGIDILVLSSLYNFGNGAFPNGNFDYCTVNSDETFSSNCAQLASDIQTCQSAGVKVFLGIGGEAADNSWFLNGPADAQGVAFSLWNSYGNPSLSQTPSNRPFGDVTIDGWDIDIESTGGPGFPPSSSQYLGNLVTALRQNFAQDISRQYYISGAPQCHLPEANMGAAMQSAQFDYLWIQFYSNDCSAGDLFNDPLQNPSSFQNQGNVFNFPDWPSVLSGGASANAALYVGLPASPAASNWFDFVQVSQLQSLVQTASSVNGFSGIMLWDAGNSNQNPVNGCTYAQNVNSVLTTGNPCGSTSSAKSEL